MGLKTPIYRNKKLLAAMKNAPVCFLCDRPNDGTIVGAHSNQIRDGKGIGLKAHDYRISALCSVCHFEIDNGKDLTRMQKMERWEKAHRETIGWLFESGTVEVA